MKEHENTEHNNNGEIKNKIEIVGKQKKSRVDVKNDVLGEVQMQNFKQNSDHVEENSQVGVIETNEGKELMNAKKENLGVSGWFTSWFSTGLC